MYKTPLLIYKENTIHLITRFHCVSYFTENGAGDVNKMKFFQTRNDADQLSADREVMFLSIQLALLLLLLDAYILQRKFTCYAVFLFSAVDVPISRNNIT